MISFQMEVSHIMVDSLLPILMQEFGCGIQTAVDFAAAMFGQMVQRLEDAEARLPLPTGDVHLDSQIRRFVQGCKEHMTGALHSQ